MIDGPVGSGKTSIIDLLKNEYPKFFYTREPGGTELGKTLRELILDSKPSLSAWTQLYLVLADRAEHLVKLKNPDTLIVSDRFIYSTIAYFGAAYGLGEDFVTNLCRVLIGNMIPDLVILLDVDPKVGRTRKLRQGPLDNLDGMPLEFHSIARNSFLKQAQEFEEPFLVIDTTEQDISKTYQMIKKIFDQIISNSPKIA